VFPLAAPDEATMSRSLLRTALRFVAQEARRADRQHRQAARRTADQASGLLVYSAYLSTPQWRHTRDMVLRRDGYRCQNCGLVPPPDKFTLKIHHFSYEHFGDEWNHMTDLVTYSDRCHKAWHRANPGAHAPKYAPLKYQTI
jgi:5-methylcytosine-specific restriction endonuclease McrA